jgi:hypothetical protein
MNFLLDHDVPDDLSYLLVQFGHRVTFLRHPVFAIRRKTRGEESAALLRLLERAGETGLRDNLNFA